MNELPKKTLGLKVSKIFPTVMKKFRKQRTTQGKIYLIQNEIEKNDDFLPDPKSDEKSIELRNQGVQMFVTGEYLQAIEYNTRSLGNAVSKECFAMAYANRSAALYKIELYDECIIDINRALSNDYPEHLQQKLIERRESAEKNKRPREPYHEEIPQIPESDRNPNIESASDCIEIQDNEEFGKHIVATRDIKINEVILVEKPFACMLSSQPTFHCHECLTLCYNLIPCDSCTQAFYCSEKCKEEALKNYHRYECPMLFSLNSIFCNVLQFVCLSLKMTFLARTVNFDELDNEDLVYRSDRYKEIYNLIRHGEKNDDEEFFALCFTVAQLYILVKRHTTFFDEFHVENGEHKFKELLLRHLQIYDVNNTEIVQIERSAMTSAYICKIIGGALYSVYSRFNHACYPNVAISQYGKTLVMRSILSIKKGEQLFTSYGELFVNIDLLTRLRNLKTKYHFDCKCPACNGNWTSDNFVSLSFERFLQMKNLLMTNANVEDAKAFIPPIISKLETLEGATPSANVDLLRDCIADCYHVLGNKRRL